MRTAMLSCALVGLAACAHTPTQSEPAKLNAPSQACVQLIQQFAERVTGQPVTLGHSIFAERDTLLLEPQAALQIDGRVRGRPEMLWLRKTDGQCVVQHPRTEAQQVLKDCSCKALDQQ
ncbi:hypothetical protein [Permianibacter aggregans]|uniref:Membrane-bound lysozyme inhibitor of c-type lysozyme MliC n=1 Tax=Permianibacter aggregans TaxID=1510150 RepID=A0A4R6US40_9GAMM|nr:hypothetical protein [Permianibacter aggregans]QGX40130.1 hypothetical protein E2H98_10790 [Permianibacter aggregans]TDQ49056.1 hypothetical protein EV696_10530 [Permianibacter aggregans]